MPSGPQLYPLALTALLHHNACYKHLWLSPGARSAAGNCPQPPTRGSLGEKCPSFFFTTGGTMGHHDWCSVLSPRINQKVSAPVVHSSNMPNNALHLMALTPYLYPPLVCLIMLTCILICSLSSMITFYSHLENPQTYMNWTILFIFKFMSPILPMCLIHSSYINLLIIHCKCEYHCICIPRVFFWPLELFSSPA